MSAPESVSPAADRSVPHARVGRSVANPRRTTLSVRPSGSPTPTGAMPTDAGASVGASGDVLSS